MASPRSLQKITVRAGHTSHLTPVLYYTTNYALQLGGIYQAGREKGRVIRINIVRGVLIFSHYLVYSEKTILTTERGSTALNEARSAATITNKLPAFLLNLALVLHAQNNGIEAVGRPPVWQQTKLKHILDPRNKAPQD